MEFNHTTVYESSFNCVAVNLIAWGLWSIIVSVLVSIGLNYPRKRNTTKDSSNRLFLTGFQRRRFSFSSIRSQKSVWKPD